MTDDFRKQEVILHQINPDLKILNQFEKGMSNHTFLVTDSLGKKYSFRIPLTEGLPFVNFKNEAIVLDKIKDLEITPKTVYFDESTGIKLTEYVEGVELSGGEHLEQVAAILKKIHNAKIDLPHYQHDLRLEKYYKLCLDNKISLDSKIKTYLDFFLTRYNSKMKKFTTYPTHGDVGLNNLIFNQSQQRVYLLDWEFSGFNDYLYDIASCSTHLVEEAELLLNMYHPGYSSEEYYRLVFWRYFQVLQWYLVASYKEKFYLNSLIDFSVVREKYLNQVKQLKDKLEFLEVKNNYDVIVILGPTASGKSELAIELAQKFAGEIINADAFQVYREMNIGTAKLSAKDRLRVPHHLFDICSYRDEFDVRLYQKLAREKILEIKERNHIPIIVGGSNLYVDSIIYNYEYTDNEELNGLKTKLEQLELHQLQRIILDHNYELNHSDFNNKRRLINICAKLESNQTLANKKDQLYFRPLFIKIETKREELYDKINHRVDHMMEEGLVREVEALDSSPKSQQAIGYKEVHQYLAGKISYPECVELIKQKSRRYAKRQLTWINSYPGAISVSRKDNQWIKNL